VPFVSTFSGSRRAFDIVQRSSTTHKVVKIIFMKYFFFFQIFSVVYYDVEDAEEPVVISMNMSRGNTNRLWEIKVTHAVKKKSDPSFPGILSHLDLRLQVCSSNQNKTQRSKKKRKKRRREPTYFRPLRNRPSDRAVLLHVQKRILQGDCLSC